jgi:DNA processing protein
MKTGGSALPEEAYAAALATLPGVTPEELTILTEEDGGGTPSAAWDRVRSSSIQDRPGWPANRRAKWRRAASSVEAGEVLVSCRRAQVAILTPASEGYPVRLRADPERPTVLFRSGRADAVDLARPTVTIVGTRHCTGYGRQVAQALGQDLGGAGIVVVSGLAEGIDSAAHQGALGRGGAVAGVVATGLDVVYPRSSAQLWGRAAERGILFSEKPPGYGATPRGFVHRNRIMAALADVVVVVESHTQGGSLSTVAAATARSVTVMAVPGPVLVSSSAGTNALIADGCAPVRDHLDVLAALGLARSAKGRTGLLAEAAPPKLRKKEVKAEQRRTERRAARLQDEGRRAASRAPTSRESELLAQIDATPTRLEVILARSGLRPGELALALDGLEEAGLVQAGPGWWARGI